MSTENGSDELITIKDASIILGCHTMTIRRWIEKGKINANKSEITGLVSIKKSDIDAIKTELEFAIKNSKKHGKREKVIVKKYKTIKVK